MPRGGSLTLTFSPQAREMITQWQELAEPRLAEDGDLADMAEFISKLPRKAARIAAILHVAKHSGTGADPFTELISEETLRSARRSRTITSITSASSPDCRACRRWFG